MTGAAILVGLAASGGGWLLLLLAGGVAGGLLLLVRGLRDYRTADLVSGIAPSRISSIAVGEVLVTGTAEPIELTLVSPLQSAACVYYRARIAGGSDRANDLFHEERAVGFRVRDPSGVLRVFPRGARFDVPDRFDERAGPWSGDPAGLLPRTGSIFGPGPDHAAQVAALLTVRDPGRDPRTDGEDAPNGQNGGNGQTMLGEVLSSTASGDTRRYTEARIDPGDVVTIVGRALPFADLADPAGANLLDGSDLEMSDPEVAADLAAARAAGALAANAEQAWGNAAIEGFGIGRPARSPTLDPEARAPVIDPGMAPKARDAFNIPADSLVLADAPDRRLEISLGGPGAVTARHQERLLVGLVGGVVAIGAAMALAILLMSPA